FAAFGDVPSSYWDSTAINYVATTNAWMRDYGTSTFKPTTIETRQLFARAIVKAFAPSEAPDPSITFTDLPTTDPFYPYANVTTKLGWIPKYADGSWRPTAALAVRILDRALVRALRLTAPVDGLSNAPEADGSPHTLSTLSH